MFMDGEARESLTRGFASGNRQSPVSQASELAIRRILWCLRMRDVRGSLPRVLLCQHHQGDVGRVEEHVHHDWHTNSLGLFERHT